MKKTNKFFAVLTVLAVLVSLCSLTSCKHNENKDTTSLSEAGTKLWSDAIYTEDTEIGKGKKEVTVKVTAHEKTITITLKTDKDNLGDALLEEKLIAGDKSDYGLYVKEVNGMVADYNKDNAYWAFLINDKYASTGVDGTEIKDGEVYTLVYSK